MFLFPNRKADDSEHYEYNIVQFLPFILSHTELDVSNYTEKGKKLSPNSKARSPTEENLLPMFLG